jgi:hypothetical protein
MKALHPPATFGHYDKLTFDHQRFVDEYLIDLNCQAAALRAGYAKGHWGANLVRDKEVRAAIEERRVVLAGERSAQGAQFVLNKLWDVATADPRELVELRCVPCRYCWGDGGQYQFSKTEALRLLKAHEYGVSKHPMAALWPCGEAERAYYQAGQAGLAFDPQGGDGYTTTREPNPACSECAGIGITLHIFHDTRTLGPVARQLYRGIKVGQNGKLEVLIANQDEARNMLAKHYGVAVERKEVFVRAVDPRKLSDDELLAAVKEFEQITLDSKDYRETPEPAVVAQWVETDKQRRRDNLAKQRDIKKAKVEAKRQAIKRPRY